MLFLQLEPGSDTPLSRQIYLQIRSRILGGELAAGVRLPASRELAADYHISRNTALSAYELLLAEGFIEGRHGSGTYVADGACLDLPAADPVAAAVPDPCPAPAAACIDFRSGVPALDRLPRGRWAQLIRDAWLEAPELLFGYQAPEGSPQLRQVLCDYLRRSRGIVCAPEQILVTSGSVQGLSLVAGVLLQEIREVILEDPCNRDIGRIFSSPGTAIHPVPVDELGIIPRLIPRLAQPALLSLTPSHQFPLGGILPISRRIELIRLARESGSWIIEDDYDSEFRYDGPPVGALQGLAPERVIYLGTFSKILFPALRLGYMVLPPAWVGPFRRLKQISDIHSNSLNQLALAGFIREGSLDRHLIRSKKLYRRRRDRLVNELRSHFPGRVRILGMSTGLHLVAEWPEVRFGPELVAGAEAAGVRIYPVDSFAAGAGQRPGALLFGYGQLDEETIAEGIRRLARVVPPA
jgi:GntR family transcriptional regulator/MocR family aminotransferase